MFQRRSIMLDKNTAPQMPKNKNWADQENGANKPEKAPISRQSDKGADRGSEISKQERQDKSLHDSDSKTDNGMDTEQQQKNSKKDNQGLRENHQDRADTGKKDRDSSQSQSSENDENI